MKTDREVSAMAILREIVYKLTAVELTDEELMRVTVDGTPLYDIITGRLQKEEYFHWGVDNALDGEYKKWVFQIVAKEKSKQTLELMMKGLSL